MRSGWARGVAVWGCVALWLGLTLAVMGAEGATARRPARTAKKPGAGTDSVLVRIGKEAITSGDVQRRIDALPEQFRANYATPEGRQQLLDRMVEERVWLVLANQAGVAARPQIKQQLEQQRRDLLVRTYINEMMVQSPAPSDSEARLYYDAHLTDYKVPATVTVRHIQSKTESDAKREVNWARTQDWNTLVKRYSTDSLTRTTGGSLGTVTREGVFASIGSQPALAESAMALGDGKVGGPYKTDKGWHVLKVDAVKPESVRPFDQVKPSIVRQLGSQRSQEFYKRHLEEARKSLGVTADSAAIKGFVSQRKSAQEMFNEAQALTAPDARIAAYRRLLAAHPDSDVAPKAQFMVGFIYSEELKNFDEAEAAFKELLRRYPKAELAPSAQWMLGHMRSEEAPAFINMDSDSATGTAPSPEKPKPNRGATRKP